MQDGRTDGRTDDGVRVKRVNNDDANAHSVRRVRHANQRREEGGKQGGGDDRARRHRPRLETSNVVSVLLSVPVISSHLGLFLPLLRYRVSVIAEKGFTAPHDTDSQFSLYQHAGLSLTRRSSGPASWQIISRSKRDANGEPILHRIAAYNARHSVRTTPRWSHRPTERR